ncbi:MAG: T9SS type A sorting domain-containing protein [Cytophagales bacterium]
MKKLVLNFIFVFLLFNVYSQQIVYYSAENHETENYFSVKLDSLQGIWQKGKPQKPIFNQPFHGSNVIITDTLNKIGSLTSEYSAYFNIPKLNVTWYTIAFKYKIDLPDKSDSVFFEISFDDKNSWYDLNKNLPYLSSFLGDQSSVQLELITDKYKYNGVNKTSWDSLGFKFSPNFYAVRLGDSATNPIIFNEIKNISLRARLKKKSDVLSEGIMIDYFKTSSYILGEVTDNSLYSQITLSKSSENQLQIKTELNLNNAQVSVYDMKGTEFKSNLSENNVIDISTINNGLYILKLQTVDHKLASFKFVK